MKIKHHKKITPPPKPKSRRYTLYTRNTSSDIFLAIGLIVFFAAGIGALFEQQCLVALMPLFVVGWVVLAKIKEVQKLDIFEDTIFVEYLDYTNTYKATDIETIEWVSVPTLTRFGTVFITVLLIKTENGKKIQIPPTKEFDIEKSLSEWLKKYQKTNDSLIAVNDTQI